MIGYTVACLLAADFLSGFFHWLEDTYCREGLPFVGELICDPNIEHHNNPTAMVEGKTFRDRNWVQFAIAWPVAFICLMAGWWPAALTLYLLSFANEIHAYNHGVQPPLVLSLLRESHILQDNRGHAVHHGLPKTTYCVMTPFLNPVLDEFGFWRSLELLATRWLNIKPYEKEPASEQVPNV